MNEATRDAVNTTVETMALVNAGYRQGVTDTLKKVGESCLVLLGVGAVVRYIANKLIKSRTETDSTPTETESPAEQASLFSFS